MMKPTFDPHQRVTRRQLIQAGLGSAGGLIAASWLAACATTPTAATAGSGSGALASAGTAAAGTSTTWASGGTAMMKAVYPDPFLTQAPAEACTLYSEATVGPCYAATMMRQDISEGLTGLPVRLALRVVRADTCEPVENATVDVWHTNASGYYSAYPKGNMCNPNDADAATKHFMRGVQTTDANGRVDFNTVYPGWYSSRTVHVHFTVRIGDEAYVTSQLFFDDALTDQIYGEHKDYNGRPARDTTNANDSVARGDAATKLIVSSSRMDDGVLQVWKTIAIKGATA